MWIISVGLCCVFCWVSMTHREVDQNCIRRIAMSGKQSEIALDPEVVECQRRLDECVAGQANLLGADPRTGERYFGVDDVVEQVMLRLFRLAPEHSRRGILKSLQDDAVLGNEQLQ
jgi:hypothetical protein